MENNNIKELLVNIQHYYEGSKNLPKKFGAGPSIYFHKECIEAGKKEYLGDRHIEMLYATLTSWGMHRMGDITKTKAKLEEFDLFKSNILNLKDKLLKLKKTDLRRLEENKDLIKQVFLSLKISKSDSLVVANSKTMHHLLLDLISPIDREHTIRFFKYDKEDFIGKNQKFKLISVPSDREEQFQLFWDIIVKIKEIIETKEFMGIKKEASIYGFYPSDPKIVDDLIMTFVKEAKGM